jgi:hypothetical protein
MKKDFVCQEEFDNKIWSAVSVMIDTDKGFKIVLRAAVIVG